MEPNRHHRDQAILWARDLLSRQDWVILDTETTGLEGEIEIVQVGLLAPSGNVLLDTLVRAQRPIPAAATAIHGIHTEDVADALPFPYVYTLLDRLIYPIFVGKQVIIYNASYDTSVLMAHCARYDLPTLPFVHNPQVIQELRHQRHVCAMQQYAAFVGAWNEVHGHYAYQKLPGKTNIAIDDCRNVLDLLHTMATAPLIDEAVMAN